MAEPLRQGLRNIQTAGADAWETILETGNFTFQSLGEVFTKTLRRMAAEFLALATVRPVLSLAVDVIGPGGLGLLGGNEPAQLGFPVGGGGEGGRRSGRRQPRQPARRRRDRQQLSAIQRRRRIRHRMALRQFSGIGDWLSSRCLLSSARHLHRPAASPMSVPCSPSGRTGASAAASGGLSIGGRRLEASASIGTGRLRPVQRAAASTASAIGSIGQIAGGAMMMIPGLQPFGAALSLLSGILPGLFGGGPKIPPQPALAYSGGAFNGSGTKLHLRRRLARLGHIAGDGGHGDRNQSAEGVPRGGPVRCLRQADRRRHRHRHEPHLERRAVGGQPLHGDRAATAGRWPRDADQQLGQDAGRGERVSDRPGVPGQRAARRRHAARARA